MTESEITPQELKRRLDGGADLFLLDVREPGEAEISQIGGSHLIPLAELPQRLGELDPQAEYIVYCKVGTRSARAVEFLRGNGLLKVKNLAGGINRWAREIDDSLPQY